MGLYQATLRIRHECPYRELSERYPDLTIREWYLRDCQVLELTSTAAPTAELLEDLERLGTVLHSSEDDEGLHVVLQSCLCSLEDSIIERFEAHNCLYQPPTVHRHGWEHYTVIAFDEGTIRAVYDDLDGDRDIEVLSKAGLERTRIPNGLVAPVDRLFDGVTARQLAAFRLALDEGYYEQPRRTSIRELADRTVVSRSTFEEHLRKAENKLLGNVGRFVRVVQGADGGDGLVAETGRAPSATASATSSD